MSGLTLFDKVWNEHIVADLGGDVYLLAVDRHLTHDLGGGDGFAEIAARGLRVRNPELTFATPDHLVSSAPGRTGGAHDWSNRFVDLLRSGARNAGVRHFDIGEDGQGIVHVIGPELGLTLPGTLIVCGDSHTCTHGALGALAWGIGTTELVHVLATQTIVQKRPRNMRVRFDGTPPARVSAKDLILALIGRIGAAGGSGFAIEYAGDAIRALDLEGRLTVCNLSIELGAKVGMVAPDEATYSWLKGRRFAPRGELWDKAVSYWRTLPSDPGASFERKVDVDVSGLAPQITWGTSPEDVIGVDESIPEPASASKREALGYMGLSAGARIIGLRVDRVFIGSCANGRLSDLREAAAIARGRRVPGHVRAWVVPGSLAVKRAAEKEGLNEIFVEAGFEWREPGCSLCLGANGEFVEPQARCVSGSNRNFVGRQGPGARTHLASPATAAACAVAGEIADPRAFAS